jgi:hypothetical protein
MRIELDTRASADALAEYLRRCGCVVAYAGDTVIHAAPPPRSQSASQGELEVDAYVRVWEAVTDGAAVRRGRRETHADG